MKNERGLIFAADVLDGKEAITITKKISEYIDGVKINYPLILSSGLGVIENLSNITSVIADFKIADVPHINKLISELAFKAGSSGIICHGFTGKESLKSCIQAGKKFGGEIYMVAEMSHPGAEKFIHPSVDELCNLALEMGVDGVVAPGNDTKRLKNIREKIGDKKILSPGIGAQGGDVKKAINAGSDYLIVGRSIYNSESPIKATKSIIESIKNAK